jgi:hypothetical protein
MLLSIGQPPRFWGVGLSLEWFWGFDRVLLKYEGERMRELINPTIPGDYHGDEHLTECHAECQEGKCTCHEYEKEWYDEEF